MSVAEVAARALRLAVAAATAREDATADILEEAERAAERLGRRARDGPVSQGRARAHGSGPDGGIESDAGIESGVPAGQYVGIGGGLAT